MIETIKTSQPLEHGLPGHGWSLKKIQQWVQKQLGRTVSHTTLRSLLKSSGLSWKKCKKLLSKANPQKRAAYISQFQQLFERLCRDEIRLLYLDESHFHQDLELGYTWALKGKPTWRKSNCPPLAARLNWYGAYDFSEGRCFIWHQGNCDGDHTIAFLKRLKQWLNEDKRQIVIIWDGAPWHRSLKVRAAATALGMQLIQLPAYSPDLNPIEGLWKWMRQDVLQHYCHTSLRQLFLDCLAFIDRINLEPELLISRLWPKFELDPDFEKLLLSN
jgi:transposase